MSWDPDWSVEAWLDELGLAAYTESFLDNGYDLQELCANLKGEDLDAIGVAEQHRKLVFVQSQVLKEEALSRFKAKSSGGGSAGSTDHSGSVSSHGSFPAYSEPWETLDKEGTANHLYSDVWPGEGTRGAAERDAIVSSHAQNGHLHASEVGLDEAKKTQKTLVPFAAPRKKKAWAPNSSTSQPLPPVPHSDRKLNKLQRKLKILEELQKDRIILSEAPYCNEVS